jgi:hypothetical protein
MSIECARGDAPSGRSESGAFATPLLFVVWIIVAATLAVAFGFALSTDDAMRLVEVRDFLAGQGWFDAVQHRLAPPEGVSMHWSRLIDLPLAALIGAGETVLARPDAERVVLAAWPVLVLLPTLAGLAELARRLGDGRAGALALVLAATVGPALVHFRPGAIDHHNVQIALLVWSLALLARDAPRPAAAAWAGFLSGLSLAIGLEMLPAIATVAVAVGVRWIVRGPDVGRATAAFGSAFAAALLGLFAVTVPPGHFAVTACDAMSIVHVVAGGLGGAGLAGLALGFSGGSWRLRLAGAITLGVVAAVTIGTLYPECLGDPFGGIDPRLTALWLDHISEVESIFALARHAPQEIVPIFGFVVAALALAAVVLRRDAGAGRWPWLLAVGAVLAQLAVALWAVRGAAVADLMAVPLIAASLVRLFPAGEPRLLGLTRPVLIAALALNQASLVVISSAAARGIEAVTHPRPVMLADGPGTCRRAADFAPLADRPAGRVLAFIDSGPYILMATGHSVLAAPYHRNGKGNGAMLDVFLAAPGPAMRTLSDLGVDYIAFCPGAPERYIYAAAAPDGLAALLGRGEAPDFLVPVPAAGTPIALYRVRR